MLTFYWMEIFLLATTISYFHLDISLFSANLPPVHLHSNTSFFIRILFFIQILIRIYLPCRDFLFLKSFSSTSHDTAHFLMTSSSLSPLQGITPLTFSIFPLDKYPYGVYIITRIIIPLQGINPNNPLTLRKESYLCPIIIVIKTRQIPIFPQTQCHAIPHPINHRSVPAAV